MEIIALLCVAIPLLLLIAYALCYAAGEADHTLEQGFREAFVDKEK